MIFISGSGFRMESCSLLPVPVSEWIHVLYFRFHFQNGIKTCMDPATHELGKYMSIEEIIAPFKSTALPRMAGKTLNCHSGNHSYLQINGTIVVWIKKSYLNITLPVKFKLWPLVQLTRMTC